MCYFANLQNNPWSTFGYSTEGSQTKHEPQLSGSHNPIIFTTNLCVILKKKTPHTHEAWSRITSGWQTRHCRGETRRRIFFRMARPSTFTKLSCPEHEVTMLSWRLNSFLATLWRKHTLLSPSYTLLTRITVSSTRPPQLLTSLRWGHELRTHFCSNPMLEWKEMCGPKDACGVNWKL